LVEGIWEKKGLELGHANDATKKHGKQVKQEGKLMKIKLFGQWLLNCPRV
jgi:hypothetical protein